MLPWLGKIICWVEAGFEAAGVPDFVWAIVVTASASMMTIKRKIFIAGSIYARGKRLKFFALFLRFDSRRCGSRPPSAQPDEVNRYSGNDQEQACERGNGPLDQHVAQKCGGENEKQQRRYRVAPHAVRTRSLRVCVAQHHNAADHDAIGKPQREHCIVEKSLVRAADQKRGSPYRLRGDSKVRSLE